MEVGWLASTPKPPPPTPHPLPPPWKVGPRPGVRAFRGKSISRKASSQSSAPVPARAMSPPHSDTLTLISCLRPFLAPILLPGGPGVEAESRN